MSTLKVNTILSETPNVTITDGLNVTGVSTVTTLNTTNLINATQLSNRNLIINGAMQVAQRGSLTGEGFSVDRMRSEINGTDESPVSTQGTVASGTTPYSLGFRNTWKIQNGNQTGGAGGSDRITFQYRFEAQDIANSGWNYTSSSSYVTLSFWVKSSVAQNFYGLFQTNDGTVQNYPFETGSLTADTWTKVTKTIPGNSNLTFDNDNGEGIKFEVNMLRGTNFTNNSVTLNQWAAYAGGTRTPDQTTTWYTTNDATFEITGVQLEVGSAATPFEHRSYADQLVRCQRYYQIVSRSSSSNSVNGTFAAGTGNDNASSGGILQVMVRFQTTMRAAPTMTQSGTFSHHVSGVNVADTTVAFSDSFIDGVKITSTQTAFVHTDGFCGELTSKYSDTSTASIMANAEF